MKHLLLIEDSRLFAQVVEQELAVNNLYVTHTATTMAKARELLATESFHVAISDLNLPDAPNGEVVPLLLEHQLPVIVLTGHAEGEVRDRINQLPLVDYVVKSSVNNTAYAARLAELLLSTRGMQVVMVGFDEEDVAWAKLLFEPLGMETRLSPDTKSMLDTVDTLSADLVLIDHEATGKEGIALLSALRRCHSSQTLPILMATAQREPALEAQLLKAGASDFLIKPFSREAFTARIINLLVALERLRNVTRYADTVDRYVITSTTDASGRILTVSQAFCDVSGYTREELIGSNHRIVRHPDMAASVYTELWQTITRGESWEGEIKNLRKDGGHYWVHARISPQFDRTGAISGYVAVRQDITDKKRIEQLSITDAMTGLYNRRHLLAVFDGMVAKAGAQSPVCGFLLFDVDKFKQYNDHYGHQAGDEVLMAVGRLMLERAETQRLAFRLGGEEFAFFGLFDSAEAASGFAESVRQALQELAITHDYNEAAKVVTASFGLALGGGEAELDTLYKQADEALYQAKEGGRNRVVVACASGKGAGESR